MNHTIKSANTDRITPKGEFLATLWAVVSKSTAKRCVEIRLLNYEGWFPVGILTIPVNYQVPRVGAVVEVGYRLAYPESKSLDYPTYLRERNDIEVHECIMSQLRCKAGDVKAWA